jgi:hypothetical protein
LLRRPDVRRELELLDDQVAKIESVSDQSREKIQSLLHQLRDMPSEERLGQIRESFRKVLEDNQTAIEQVLLPHQRKRLGQIARQIRLRSGLTALLADASLTEQLGMKAEELDELRKQARQIDLDTQAKIAKLRQDAHTRFADFLTEEQRAKLHELLGEPFVSRLETSGASPKTGDGG